MSDPRLHDSLSDDLFRRRITAALQQLDPPESDAELEAALDAVEAEPINEHAAQRILGQLRSSIAAATQPGSTSVLVNGVSRNHDVRHLDLRHARSTSQKAQVGILVACVSLLIVLGVVFGQFRGLDRDMVAELQTKPQSLSKQLIRAVTPTVPRDLVAAAERVKPGETISTGPREKRRVTLPDGSVLSINEKTKVTIIGPRRVKLLAGELFVEVVPVRASRLGDASDASERFVVETARRQVTALGTKFVVKAEGSATNVVVTQGKVQVSGVAQIIAAGQELMADLTESKSWELRPARRSAYVVEWVKELMAATNALIVPASEHSGGTITVIDPQGDEMKLSLRKFHVDVHIEDGFARTTIDQTYFNHTWQQLEGTFRFPLPADASLSRLAMYVNGTLMEGGMVERDYGRNVFEQIRHTRRDPALLEWIDGSTFQMRVFPLEARQEKRILLSYTQRLPSDYGKAVYRFPTGHNLDGVQQWSTHLLIKGGAGTKWYSPSHLLDSRNDGSDLVIEGREEYAAMDRDLVLELGDETLVASAKSDPIWSRFEQDSFQYLMVRVRPELKPEMARPQRHWVFLIENSADRNTVLAETQRQIAKVLLENFEHGDTFSIVRAGTQPDLFRDKPVDCSLDHVAAAQDFLKEVAPIGALDLGQALQIVQQQATAAGQTWIIHLGTGIPVLGERDQTTLIRQLPTKARYVGVAVGKRWSKSFMEAAAKQSGGQVVQINPDEAVAWRAFDLLSTLNAPRLTEIQVSTSAAQDGKPAVPQVEFLPLGTSVSHGQELAAVARLPIGQVLPKSIMVTGKVNGEAYSQSVSIPESLSAASNERPVASAGQGAVAIRSGHLPRTWARAQIDRLVELGSTEHKAQIIELSKAMYVMSPFTSLLVLETEAMYEQFKVDRGRKDHWALYGAPAQIPVVAEQGAVQLTGLDAAKERLKQAMARVATIEKNYERSVAAHRPASDLKKLERSKQAELAAVKLLEGEIQQIERANVEAADPIRKAWDSVIARRILWYQGYPGTYSMYWNRGYWSDQHLDGLETLQSPTPFTSYARFFRFGDDTTRLVHRRGGQLHDRFHFEPTTELRLAADTNGNIEDFVGDVLSDSSVRGRISFEAGNRIAEHQLALTSPKYSGLLPGLEGTESFDIQPDDFLPWRSVSPYDSTLFEEVGLSDVYQYRVAGSGDGGGFGGFVPNMSQPFGWAAPTINWQKPQQWASRFLVEAGKSGLVDGLSSDLDDIVQFSVSNPYRFGINSLNENVNGIPALKELGELQRRTARSDLINGQADFGYISSGGRGVRYRRPMHQVMVNGGAMGGMLPWGAHPYYAEPHPLASLLQDLPSYAPGLQTWLADRLAIAEKASVKKPTHGTVDPEARRLIEKARSLGWQSIRLIARNQIPARDSETVIADGSGRFKVDREVSEGLKETVINDGATLWHLYPEMGLGAKRILNRFHQSAIQSLIPWYVPSADDLSVNADVTLAGERTVRITMAKQVGQLPVETADEQHLLKRPVSKSQESATPELAVELVFADEGRLTELRLIDVRKNKRLAKETIADDGTIRLLDADDKVLNEVQYERLSVPAPNLVPVNRDLVVLPLPYRSSDSVDVSVPVNLQNNSPDFARLSDDDALKLLATYFAEARQSELPTFIEQRFTARGDQRIGLAVLMSSVVPQNPMVANATQKHPDLPLARFLEQFAAWIVTSNLNGQMDIGANAAPFLKRICGAYNHYCRWSTDRAATRERSATEIEHELDQTLRYVIECRSLDLMLNLLATIQEGLKRVERMNPTFARQMNAAVTAIAADRGFPGFARTDRIEWLLLIGDAEAVAAAEKLFRAQLFDAIDGGFVPNLRSEVRTAFVKQSKTPDGQSCTQWVEVVREAVQQLSTMDRPMSLVSIARRCVALGEPAFAAEIVQKAIKDQDLKAKQKLNLAVLEYSKDASDWSLAEACVKLALSDALLQQKSGLWRDAARVGHRQQKFSEWIENLEKAYEIEFAALPKTVNLEKFRQDYDALFGQLEERTEQLVDANRADKESFARVVQRAAMRWREIDTDDTIACHRAARMLSKLGFATAAWNYWTTPLAEKPDLSTAWTSLANAMENEHRFKVADKAWATAFVCEPTNPEILLNHARFLQSTHQKDRARSLLLAIITGNWQPRFEGTKTQAQTMLAK